MPSPKHASRALAAAALFALACQPGLKSPTYPAPQEITKNLKGLALDDFYEKSYHYLLERSPETLSDLGMSAAFGLGDNYLDDVSDAFLKQNYDVAEAILRLLRSYDRAALSPEAQVSYDVYAWYLDDVVRERPFMYYIYSINPGLTSEHQKLVSLFTQVHPLATRQNAENYLERLRRVPAKIDQVIEGLNRREGAGLVMPASVLAPAAADIERLAAVGPQASVFYRHFSERLDQIAELSGADRQKLRDQASQIVETVVLPAFVRLGERVRALQSRAPAGDGVWALKGGDAYYAYAVRHHTTLDMSADDVHALGLQEVARLKTEIATRMSALGYPAGESLGTQFDRVARASGTVAAGDCIGAYDDIIAFATARLDAVANARPRAAVVTKPDPIGGYYIPAANDGTRPGVFYAFIPSSGLSAYTMPTLAYHEAVPGHHLQIGVAREMSGLPTFRGVLSFTAQAEGWALYAERLAVELGWYAGEPYGDLGRLQYEMFRAVRLVVDTGIHAKRWSADQARAYMRDNTGFDDEVVNVGGQIMRYMAWPGQATAYKIGMQEILRLRAAAQASEGNNFDVKSFHDRVLRAGSVPLPVLGAVLGQGR